MCATHRMLRVRAVVVTALWPASVRCWRVDTLCAHVELTLACVCTRANRTSPSTTHPPNPTELRDIKTRACRALEDRGNTGTLEGAALPVPRASHFINVDNSLSLLPSMGIQCIACLRGVGLACVLGLTSTCALACCPHRAHGRTAAVPTCMGCRAFQRDVGFAGVFLCS